MVRRMFFETADLNYLAARDAFADQRYWDFWWLTNHAIEKYLKALLLLNMANPRDKKHSPTALLGEVANLDPRLVPSVPPEPKIAGLSYWPSSYDSFLVLLERQGSASNRYGTYGFAVDHTHLLQADHLVFWARRHARPLTTTDESGNDIDWIANLEADGAQWMMPNPSHLEKLHKTSASSRKRQTFSRRNTAFFPEMRHKLKGFPFAFSNAPIYLARERIMASAAGSETRQETRMLLAWVLDHIVLYPEEKADLRGLLAQYS